MKLIMIVTSNMNGLWESLMIKHKGLVSQTGFID